MMTRQCGILTIATLLTCLLLGALSASPDGAVFWVAPTLEQCGNRTAGTDNVQCNTLKGYQKNSSIFSTSHSKWIFLKGEHMADSPITVSGATNITWTGEAACTPTTVKCAILIPACKHQQHSHHEWGLRHHTTVTFQNSQTILLAFLVFFATQDTWPCNHAKFGRKVWLYQAMLTLENVFNAAILSAVMKVTGNDYRKEFKSHVVISEPCGMWLIDKTVFSQTRVTMNITHCISASFDGLKCNFSASIIGSVFHRSTLSTRTDTSVSDTYNAVNITMLRSKVFIFHLELKGYSADNFSLSLMKCTFTKINFRLPVLSIPETRHHTASVNILLWEVKFICYPKPCNMILFIQIQNHTKFDSGCGLLLPNITMSHYEVEQGFFSLGPYSVC